MSLYAIIVAGGKGVRMTSELPKQFIEIGGLPIIVHSVNRFLSFDATIRISVTIPGDHFRRWDEIKQKYLRNIDIQTVEGGETRFHSVKNALEHLSGEGYVAVHDAVRPCVTTNAIAGSYEKAKQYGSAVVAVPLKDSIREKHGSGTIAKDRSDFWIVQTPQTFDLRLLKLAYDRDFQPAFTDDASVYEAAGYDITLVEGSYENIKITTPGDLRFAEAILS